jgi:hypothetical protein
LPVFGAVLLSLFGAIVAFFSTLALLDGTFVSTFPSTSQSRIGAFAAPGLSVIGPASLATLRPISVPIVPATGTTSPGAEPASVETPTASRKSAIVAPLVRRAPPTPVLASDETQPVTQPSAIAKAPTSPQLHIATRKLIAPELRSALGGPLPASSVQAAPAATKPRPRLAPTRESSPQGPSP